MKELLLSTLLAVFITPTAMAQNTPTSQMEKLDRGLVALPAASGSGTFLSWRLLGTEDESTTTFDVIKGSAVIAENIYATNYVDNTKGASYRIVTKVNGEVVETSEPVSPWGEVYKTITLDRPATGSANGGTYSPNDMSVGDIDGDGEYELFVKWDPSTSKDNSQSGITDNVYIDCYKMDGTKLWRIDLGRNIRAGAHYTHFMVYDFDGDGRAEMICKTAPGSKDAQGNYVNQAATNATIKAASNTKSWLTSDGRVNGGQEYLTVFNGATGAAIHTIEYYPTRNGVAELSEAAGTLNWYDSTSKNDLGSYGNRGERYLAAVAYLDGPDKNASAIFCRGYYTFAYIYAVSFDGQHLKKRWLHSSETKTSYKLTTFDDNETPSTRSVTSCIPTSGSGSGTMYGNGNHNLSVSDVDGDGCDEIIWGSAGLNNDGTLLYGTGFGHGDAMHLADHCPDRPGLEVFQVHEEKGTYAWDLHDAATGEVLLKGGPAGVDNGRGMAGQFDANVRGSLFWSSSDDSARSAVTGEVISTNHGSSNFRIYWDGDVQEELFDGGKIDKWNGNGTSRVYLNDKNLYDYNHSSTCNGTKSTPNLQADILGDWREEVIMWNAEDSNTLNIFTTNTPTEVRMPTLMHDHTYRMGVCWENTAYNQPPHLGYYLPDAVLPDVANTDTVVTAKLNEEITLVVNTRNVSTISMRESFTPSGRRKGYGVPEGWDRMKTSASKQITLHGTPVEEGDYRFHMLLTGTTGETRDLWVRVQVTNQTAIRSIATEKNSEGTLYDLCGRPVSKQYKGIAIRNGRKIAK